MAGLGSETVDDLRKVVGDRWVSMDTADLLAYSRDLWPRSLIQLRSGKHTVHPPAAVVWPGSVDQVGAVVRLLVAAGAPIVPFGAGSGVCGGTLPIRGGVVVDLKRLRAIRSIDPVARLVDVEAGIIGEDLERSLAVAGFTLGHFPSSIYCSSLGGWIATRSAGQMSTLYGKIEDMVSEVGCVTSDGRRHVLRARPGRGQGPGFCQLVVGSEGTYALVTDARLRIRPAPEARRFRAFRFPDVQRGVRGVRLLMQAGLRPSVVRLYDALDSILLRAGPVGGGGPCGGRGSTGRLRSAGRSVARAAMHAVQRAALGRPGLLNTALDLVPQTALGGCILVLVFEGRTEIAEAEERIAADLLLREAVDLGSDPARVWYEHRYAVSYRQSPMFASGGFSDTMEVAATWDRLLDVYAAVRRALGRKVLLLAHFSHAYHEGCSIYFTFAGRAATDEDALVLYDDVWRSGLAAVLEAGGVISHHHGVGVSKASAMEGEYGPALQIGRAVKEVLDPTGLLNPGKLFDAVPAPLAAPAAVAAPSSIRGRRAAEVSVAELERAVPGGVRAEGDPPVLTVTPGDAPEVAACLRIATEHRIPVLSRSETTQPRLPPRSPAILLSLERMQSVREVSEEALTVHADAGIRVRALEDRLAEHALALGYPLLADAAPKLGGLLGGRGWGEGSVGLGSFEEACVGLEAVLPYGEAIRIKPSPRRAAGPDLMQVFVGAEGAFGVITGAVLRVRAMPRGRRIVGAWFATPGEAIGCLASILADSVRPAAARVVRPGPAWATASMRGEAALVLVFESIAGLADAAAAFAIARIEAAEATPMHEDDPLLARNPVELIGEARRGIERVEAAGPWPDLLRLDREAAALLRDDLVCCRWSNAYPEGGTASWTILSPESATRDARRPAFRLVGLIADRDAALSAYRGPRPLPAALARRVHGALWPWFRSLKQQLDPSGILNSGALGL